MKKNSNSGTPLPFDTKKTKDQLRREIAMSLTPEQRLQKLNAMIRFNKRFSPHYREAFLRRLYEGDAYILK